MGDEPSAIREVAENPVMLAEAKAALPALAESARRPAGAEGVARVIGRRLAILPTPQKSEGEWTAWWADYVAILGDLPESAIEAGMSAYLRDPKAEWMPLPGKLRALALETPNTAVRAYDRARRAIEASQPPERRKVVDRAEVDRLMEDFRAGRLKREPPPPPPPFEPPVDEKGLTAEMREALQRRQA